MADKTWENMTQAEKIEDLRNDVVRIFRLLSSQATALDRQKAKLSEVGKEVEVLRRAKAPD